jgi:hypothetical protein
MVDWIRGSTLRLASAPTEALGVVAVLTLLELQAGNCVAGLIGASFLARRVTKR